MAGAGRRVPVPAATTDSSVLGKSPLYSTCSGYDIGGRSSTSPHCEWGECNKTLRGDGRGKGPRLSSLTHLALTSHACLHACVRRTRATKPLPPSSCACRRPPLPSATANHCRPSPPPATANAAASHCQRSRQAPPPPPRRQWWFTFWTRMERRQSVDVRTGATMEKQGRQHRIWQLNCWAPAHTGSWWDAFPSASPPLPAWSPSSGRQTALVVQQSEPQSRVGDAGAAELQRGKVWTGVEQT